MPLKVTVCGLPSALSVMESVPFRLPEALGVKVTLMMQLAPDAKLDPQLSLSPKFEVASTLVMLSVTVP